MTVLEAPGTALGAMQFTPATALLGGLTLGIASLGKYAITGRILGISGALKGFVQGNVTAWRVLFTAGMVVGAWLAREMAPAAFDVLPATFTVARGAVGGFLVGLGAAIGNGCTSGHGISGNARLSVRSMVYTMVFMVAGMAAATLTHTPDALAIAPKSAELAWPTPGLVNTGLMLLAASVAAYAGLVKAAQNARDKKTVELTTEFVSGMLFALGLVYTGMVRPSKVAAFLAVTHPAWDLSLAFVMGGALLVAAPGFQAIMHWKVINKPYAAPKFDIPAINTIDPKLILGGVLFGLGWGISGMCPGPAVVAAVATPVPQILANVGAMLAGMWVQKVLLPTARSVMQEAKAA